MNPVSFRTASLLVLFLLPVVFLTACGETVQEPPVSDTTPVFDEPVTVPAEETETEAVYHPAPIDELLTEETEALPPKVYTFTEAPEDYFSDALFIGDSRTVGLSDYSPLPGADYFSNIGMSVYSVMSAKVPVGDLGSVTLEELLSARTYGKIYLMLGINELGYGRNATVERYGELVSFLRERQPDALLFLEANLHVTATRSAEDEIINNPAINDFNTRISAFADNTGIFYIDINEAFDDAYGNLRTDYTFDDAHLLAEHYETWNNWLKTKAILK